MGFICECWKRKAVKAEDVNTFTKQADEFKQTLSARKLMVTVFWEHKRSANVVIHATTYHNNVESVSCVKN
jgi:hypothetical protein